MITLELIPSALFEAIVRAITGRLFTDDQITAISKNAVGKYLSDFLPTPKEEQEAGKRFEKARGHISAANSILCEMQADLTEQEDKLNLLLKEVEKNRELAERYQTLAETKQVKFQAFHKEMEESLRAELVRQSEEGRRLRQVASIAIWLLTIVASAALGAYFKKRWVWFYNFFGGVPAS